MTRVLISGASGMVGSALSADLEKKGAEVFHLVRNANPAHHQIGIDLKRQRLVGVDQNQVFDCFFHLGGAGIADRRWTARRKKEIVDSRVQTLNIIHQELVNQRIQIKQLVSASGINFYPNTQTQVYTEADAPGASFLAQVCVQWENAAMQFAPHMPVSCLRTGVVLSLSGGALPKLDRPIRWGLGAALGSGRQPMPWIALSDLVALYEFAFQHRCHGAINAVAPEQVTHMQLIQTAAKLLKKPLWLPHVPAWLLKLALGEMSEMLLEGTQASAQLALSLGFRFQHEKLENALAELYATTGAPSTH